MATSASSSTEFVSMPLLAVKDEPQDDPEMADSNFVDSQTVPAVEPDPMNLLDTMVEAQISDEPNSEMSIDQLHQDAAGPSDELWQTWMAQFPWLLHEEEDGVFGYCLYCNSNVSFKYLKSPAYHAKLRTHREKEENYLAFKQSEEHANLSTSLNGVTIKQEFGTDSNSSAIRFKRISQTEPLFNFMWHRWQKRHPWLERDKDEPTHGNCKYCKHRLYVEYSYIRTRHELGIKHRIAEKQWKLKNAKGASDDKNENDQNAAEKQSELEEQQSEQESANEGESTEQSNRDSDEQHEEQYAAPLKRKRRSEHNSPWRELQTNNPLTCRCKLCNVLMHSHNFPRHLKTRVHIEAEKAFNLQTNDSAPKVKQEFAIKLRNWKMFAKKHPWLIGDPDDSNFGYCKYCKVRLLHASHPVKRLLHERGARHQNALRRYQNKMSKAQVKTNNEESEKEHRKEVDEEENEAAESSEEASEDSQENEEDQDDEDDQEDAETEKDDEEDQEDDEEEEDQEDDEEDKDDEDNVEKKSNGRLLTSSDAWFKMFSWCKRIKGEPNFMLCTYCNLKIKLSVRRRQHERTQRHKEAAKANAKAKHPSQPLTSLQRSQKDKRCSYFPWLVFTKNPAYVFCKYCSLRLTSATSRTQHELTKRHKESARQFQQNDKKKKSSQNTSNNLAPVNVKKSTKKASKPLVFRSMKTKVTMWKAKFPWITYKRGELQPNYGFCKYCELRVFMPSEKFASKHQRTIKHRLKLQIMRRKEQEEEEKEEEQREEEEPKKSQESSAEKSSAQKVDWDWDALKKEYPWLLPDKKKEPCYGFCNYCKKRLNVSRHFRVRHQETITHKKAESEFLLTAANTEDNPDKSKEKEAVDSSVVELDDDDMNDNSSVKSEPMTEDEVIDFLLQRSQQSKTQNYFREADLNDSTEPAARKRQKLSTQHDSVKDRARRITTAHLEILRLTRDLNERKTQKKSNRMSLPSSILRTSTAIAALMSPPRAPTPPAPTMPPSTRNNYELFFDSVCESIKTLPADLAAEGKIKVAQLVADLETRALNRSQSKEFVDNTNNIQIVTTPLSSSTNTSPALSTVDMPSTTTNGLEKDQTYPSTPLETGPTPMVSSYSLDRNLRIIPLGSTPNYRPSDSTSENSIRRLQMSSTQQATQNSIKRVQVNSSMQQPNARQHMDGTIQVVESFANSTPVRGTLANQKTTLQTQGSSPSPLASYQHVQQIIASSPDPQRSVTQQPIQTQGNTTIIDNGFRRIHLGARPQPTSETTDMSFRRIQLPFKGTTITKTTKATPPSTYYFNHSKNV